MLIYVALFGFAFGLAMQYARLNEFNTIVGLAVFKNYTLLKAYLLAVGIGILLIHLEIGSGYADYNVKRLYVLSIVLGAILFGTGMALVGYCPASLAISAGYGSVDAMAGIAGGLAGGLVAAIILPHLLQFLGPHLNEMTFYTVFYDVSPALFYGLSIFGSALLIFLAFYLHKNDRNRSKKWIGSGILIAILVSISLLRDVFDRVPGASAGYSWFVGRYSFLQDGIYHQSTKVEGKWEFVFLLGAFISALFYSLLKKRFKIKWNHTLWRRYEKSLDRDYRLFWAFTGGFFMILGARIAGGCTVGHILSGQMQLSVTSMLFMLVSAPSFFLTAHLFYKTTPNMEIRIRFRPFKHYLRLKRRIRRI